ncbi:hypothetical protein BCR34DRAFT_388177 [Clohesyomyces aquaticus]|uniref:Uncharacterized protein n=1 Tax=Clohesyomyces aquaticus TaxID=1231657 RepID=A0A1Y1ZEX6_9PLEO|nr:hypothetical protein BCR34DRAFT_388177 [Clohesyomyces aquaticus]
MENFPGTICPLFSSQFSLLILKRCANRIVPGFALAASLSQVLAPTDAQVVSFLGFHIIAKLFVHYPAYLSNVAVPRAFAHISATAR